jgi:hypothetical protein
MITDQASAQHHFQRTLDAVDNRQRVQNLRLHGIPSDRVTEELQRILPVELHEQIDIAYAAGPNQGNHKPVLVRFKTVSACEKANQLVRSQQFRDDFPHIRPAHDSSELLRVGASRIRAAEEELKAAFEGVVFLRDGIRYKGTKYPASEFASSHVVIDGVPFNVNSAVRANPDYETADSVHSHVRGSKVHGVRLKRGRGRGRGRGGWAGWQGSDRNESREKDGRAASNNGRGRGRGSSNSNNQRNLVDTVPPTSGLNAGQVNVFSYGNVERERGGMRNLVMGVSKQPLNYQVLFAGVN